MKGTMTSQAYARVAAFLPTVAIALSVFVSHWNQSQGQRWDFPVRAFDPRDILRGKYLNLRFGYDLEESGCEQQECCVCFSETDFAADPPRVFARPCEQIEQSCKTWMSTQALGSSYRYFIPEAQSAFLEEKVMNAAQAGRARVQFVLDAKGRPQITALKVDGKPLLLP